MRKEQALPRGAIDVAGTGFTVLDRIYADDAASFEALGGSCGNVLVSLALLDRRVAPVIALGVDAVGDVLSSEFAEAGADISYIFRNAYIASPILIQLVNTAQGQHEFSFVCPDTDEDFPRYTAIEQLEVGRAASALNQCSIFYADRLTEAIASAMEMADQAGALVYFEPSAIDDPELFRRALRHTSILKYSSERFPVRLEERDLPKNSISIVTYGAEGLELRRNGRTLRCGATKASLVRDTSGSGDMVTVGIIDRLLSLGRSSDALKSLDALIPGIIAGQRLAAANCAFTGARGLFRHCGPITARAILDGLEPDLSDEIEPGLF
jgi:fructokinase